MRTNWGSMRTTLIPPEDHTPKILKTSHQVLPLNTSRLGPKLLALEPLGDKPDPNCSWLFSPLEARHVILNHVSTWHVGYFLGLRLGFELRASQLQSRHSDAWATPPVQCRLTLDLIRHESSLPVLSVGFHWLAFWSWYFQKVRQGTRVWEIGGLQACTCLFILP
jgi:hypothetical protein